MNISRIRFFGQTKVAHDFHANSCLHHAQLS